MTWLRCCIIATEMNYKVVKRGKTVAEWYLQLHRFDSLQFCRSKRGRQSSQAKSPFGEDELLTTQFKGWARSDLEHLSIQKAQNFINNQLLADWIAHQLNANKISYPVTEYIVGRWMREAGFMYELHKKVIMWTGMKIQTLSVTEYLTLIHFLKMRYLNTAGFKSQSKSMIR